MRVGTMCSARITKDACAIKDNKSDLVLTQKFKQPTLDPDWFRNNFRNSGQHWPAPCEPQNAIAYTCKSDAGPCVTTSAQAISSPFWSWIRTVVVV